MREERVIVALDAASPPEVLRLVGRLREQVSTFKIGLTAYTAGGNRLVQAVQAMGCEVFLDLKLIDIPQQVAGAARSITRLGAKMFTISAFGGIDMMRAAAQAAREQAEEANRRRPLLVAVTVLTSLDQADVGALGIGRPVAEEVSELARLAQEAGLDGVVASGHETAELRKVLGRDFALVVPGVRPAGTLGGDQKRVVSPRDAFEAGADYVVVGRPVTEASDPVAALAEVLKEVS